MTQSVYGRQAVVEREYSETARVRYRDNGTLGYVPLSEVRA